MSGGFQIPGPNLPDPLRGMGSSSYGLPTDSISQAMKTHRSQTKTDLRYQSWSTAQPTYQAPGVSPIEEETAEGVTSAKGKGKEVSFGKSRDPRPPDGSRGFGAVKCKKLFYERTFLSRTKFNVKRKYLRNWEWFDRKERRGMN
ncbi:hypothetical protein B0H13DRAFT_1853083 [Mycena leptocephala]|nr:hypothetical protein B0H13DRAFT_1853083 [Mycena leptocephala]